MNEINLNSILECMQLCLLSILMFCFVLPYPMSIYFGTIISISTFIAIPRNGVNGEN